MGERVKRRWKSWEEEGDDGKVVNEGKRNGIGRDIEKERKWKEGNGELII